MKLIIVAIASLMLASCAATGTVGNVGGVPITVATADEKALLTAEGTYHGLLLVVNAGLDAGIIKGDRARQTAAIVRQAKSSLDKARAAYRIGQTVQATAELRVFDGLAKQLANLAAGR